MADNTTLNTMTGGDVIAADDISGVKFQRVKLVEGADGVNDGDISAANPLPVSLASVPSHAVTNAGTFAVQVDGSALTSLQLIDDAIATVASAITTKGIAAAGTDGTNARILKTDTSGELQIDILTIAAGDNNIGNVDIASALPAGTNAIGKLAANSGVDIGDVDVTSIIPGTGATNLGKAEDGAHTSGDVGVMALGVANVAQGSFAADNDYIPLAVDLKGNVMTVGNLAHDDADAGNPVKIGHKAIAHGTNPTAVAANDRTNWYANRAGVPFVIGGHPNILTASINVTDADGAQTNAAVITVSTGAKIIVTHIAVMADNANTTDVGIRVGFGTANTPAADAAGLVLDHPGLAAGSGVVLGNGAGIIGVGADNEDLRITCEDPVGGSISLVVGYYTIES